LLESFPATDAIAINNPLLSVNEGLLNAKTFFGRFHFPIRFEKISIGMKNGKINESVELQSKGRFPAAWPTKDHDFLRHFHSSREKLK
jgi:hypothetical protein